MVDCPDNGPYPWENNSEVRTETTSTQDVREALEAIPQGVYSGANRYDTDDEYVLTMWRDGHTVDIRVSKV